MDHYYNPKVAQRPSIERSAVKSVARALAILELFDEMQRPLSTAEVSTLLDYPFSSVAALLKALTERGYLRREQKGRRFAPSLRLALLGNWVDRRLAGGRSDVVAFMQDLHELTGRTVALQWRNGAHLQFLHVIESHGRPDWHIAAGMVRPLLTSASGYALLSLLQDQEIVRIVTRHNAERDCNEPRIEPAAFLEMVNTVRRDGYLFVRNTVPDGSATLSAPLPRRADEPMMVVTIGGDFSEMEKDKDQLVTLLLSTIRDRLKESEA